MAPTLPNTITTRLRQRRDLEATMNTLKQLLEPTITTKKGSRKKNKPRSLAKKDLPRINHTKRFENSEDDGEYYPNTLKRKVRLKKTVLKPRHELKVVVATNKRKRGTPHKGLNCIYEKTPNLTNKPPDINVHTRSNVQNEPRPNVHTELCPEGYVPFPTVQTNVQTAPGINVHVTTNQDIYELISPPHKSLTRLTADDLIRMDEDSLSDEDLMEILTCPSPVWWEDPTEECKGSLYLTTATDIQEPLTNGDKSEIKTYSHKKGAGIKRAGPICVTASKAKKIAKLENILGHIKNITRNNNKVNSVIGYRGENEVKFDKDDDKIEDVITDTKRRTISSSGSEISVNEEDLLRNLESIGIPIRKIEESISHEHKNDENINDEEGITLKKKLIKPIDEDVTAIYEKVEKSSENEEAEGKKYSLLPNKKKEGVLNKQNKTAKKKIDKKSERKKRKQVDTNNKANGQKREKNTHKNNKNALKKVKKRNDGILDVRLIKIPTNVSNEVKIWSQLDNCKRHSLDFESNVIDIEDELEFSMIENSPTKDHPLGLKNETILIDDDSNDNEVNKSIFNTEHIEKCNNVTLTAVQNDESSQNSETAEYNTKTINEIIKEDTIRIGNDLDVRLIETEDKIKPNPKSKHKACSNEIHKINTEQRSLADSFEYESPIDTKPKWHINEYLQYGEQSNERGIFRVLDTEDSDDTILRLNDDVDVSLVNNPPQKKDKAVVNESKIDLSITLVKKTVKGVSTPVALPTLKKNPKPTFDSPKSVKSATSDTVESEGTISDTNIQFLDEYVCLQTDDKVEDIAIDRSKSIAVEKQGLDNKGMNMATIIKNEDKKKLQNVDTEDRIHAKEVKTDDDIKMDNAQEISEDDKVELNCEQIINNEKKDDKIVLVQSRQDVKNQEFVTIYRIFSNKDNVTDGLTADEVKNTVSFRQTTLDSVDSTN